MKIDNLKKFVDFAWDFILDSPCGATILLKEWEIDEDGNPTVIDKAFKELDAAEDAESVIHAHWIHTHGFNEECSNCGCICSSKDVGWRNSYGRRCPCCGAKMGWKK